MDDKEWGEWFDGIMFHRETVLYPQFFGAQPSEFYSFPENLVSKDGVDLLEESGMSLNLVMEFGPNEKRKSWLYVTSGMSNPVGETPDKIDINDFSGIGFEMIIETPEKCKWPVNILHTIMFSQCLISACLVEGELIEYNDIFPIQKDSIADSPINSFVAMVPNERCNYPKEFCLSSGKVDFFSLFGITISEELLFLEKNAELNLPEFFEKAGYPVNNIFRESVEAINNKLNSKKIIN